MDKYARRNPRKIIVGKKEVAVAGGVHVPRVNPKKTTPIQKHSGVTEKKKNNRNRKKKKKKTGRLNIEKLTPPVDNPGEWVERRDFDEHKSFGAFECPRCHKTWLSAHAFPVYKQGCKKCDRKSFPKFLWKNEHYGGGDNENKTDSNKPHDITRCDACKDGVCVAGT